jgi:hypothetical protein
MTRPSVVLGICTLVALFSATTEAFADTPSLVVDFGQPGPHQLTDAPELVLGTPRDDVIDGVGAGDVVYSRAGNDQVSATPNEPDSDYALTDARIYTGSGHDLVNVYHRSDSNEVDTGPGDDVILVGYATLRNRFATGPGADRFLELAQSFVHYQNTVDLGTGDDYGEVDSHEAGENTVYGRAGADVIVVEGGHNGDRVVGGPGKDSIRVDAWSNTSVLAGTGDDDIEIVFGDGGAGNLFSAGPGADRLTAIGGASGARVLMESGNDAVELFGRFGGQVEVDGGTNRDSIMVHEVNPLVTCTRFEIHVGC